MRSAIMAIRSRAEGVDTAIGYSNSTLTHVGRADDPLQVLRCEELWDRHRTGEGANTSIDYDRDEKLPRYAMSGIPEAWLIDINQQVVEQYTQPRNGKYRNKLTLERGDTLTAQRVSGLRLSVDSLFA